MATPLNMITAKYNTMGLETGIIKGSKTKYFKKSENKEVITYSKTINLGVKSNFNIDDVVAVLPIKEYDDLMANTTNTKEINKAKETITELNKEIDNKDGVIATLSNDKESLTNTIAELNKENKDTLTALSNLKDEINAKDVKLTEIMTILKQYDIKEVTDLNTLLNDYRVALNYLADCLIAYEKQGRLKRFLKENPTIHITKPPLKLIDYRGNKAVAISDEIKATKVNDPNKYE